MRHVAVFIDHHEAKVFHVDATQPEENIVKAPHHHLRSETRSSEKEHPADQMHFYQSVTKALADADEILIVGPAAAKNELVKYANEHAPALEKKIVGVETVDHPTDRQIAAFAKKYFGKVDRMKGLTP